MCFDLRHLRYVVAAADHRSFFRAALALEIEQSTMSRNIVRLEQRLGVKLFRRSHAGVSPTSAGDEFIRSARQILARSEHLVSAMQSVGSGQGGRLRIGRCHSVPTGPLNDILVAWHCSYPAAETQEIEAPREMLISALDAQMIDLAILPGERVIAGMPRLRLWTSQLQEDQLPFSAYWSDDNGNPVLAQFLASMPTR